MLHLALFAQGLRAQQPAYQDYSPASDFGAPVASPGENNWGGAAESPRNDASRNAEAQSEAYNYSSPANGENPAGETSSSDRWRFGADGWPTGNRAAAPPAEQAPTGSPRFTEGENLGPYDNDRLSEEFRPSVPEDLSKAPTQQQAFEFAKQIAIVNNEVILAGELLGDINQMLKPYEGKIPEDQLELQKQLLMQQILPRFIETKMLYQEIKRTMPPEAMPDIERKLADEFDKTQLVRLMERAKVQTAGELDVKLRAFGTSIEKQRRSFGEQVLAREYIRQNIEKEPEISHQEMVEYYRKNSKDYERPARVRWEELAVRFEKFNTKDEAYQAMANMGNRVLRGAAFSRVAREDSQGFTADDGGWHDWTIVGSLKAREIEEAIFNLPTNRLSQIIETEDGFHIIRVLDREDAGRSPFVKEQGRIKKKLQQQRMEKQMDEVVTKVKARTRIWTIFDDHPIDPTAAASGANSMR